MRRRRPRASKVLAVLSLVLAAGATLILRGHLARLEARARSVEDVVPVVLAETGLPRGTVVTAGMIRTERIPDRYAPPGAIRSQGSAVGRTLAADLTLGEVLTEHRLARAGPVAALVPDGLRAIPISVPLPPGAVAPGDRVDVLATFAGPPHAEIVVPEAEVLSLRSAGGMEEFGPTATVLLLVTPEGAESLAFARAFADLSLAIAPGQ